MTRRRRSCRLCTHQATWRTPHWRSMTRYCALRPTSPCRCLRWSSSRDGSAGSCAQVPDAIKATCALLGALFVHALHQPLGSKIVQPLCRILPMDLPAKRSQAVMALLDAFACFEDWSATIDFLDALLPETVQSLERFLANVEAVGRLRRTKGCLFRTLRRRSRPRARERIVILKARRSNSSSRD